MAARILKWQKELVKIVVWKEKLLVPFVSTEAIQAEAQPQGEKES